MGATPGRSAWQTVAKLASAVAVLVATDYYLTVYAYGYSFHARGYFVTWLWYAAVCLIGMSPTESQRAAGRRRCSGVSHVVLPAQQLHGLGWRHLTMYPRTLAGLGACYMAAIPFYRNDVVSTAITAGALFGLPVLAARIVESLHTAQQDNLPLA